MMESRANRNDWGFGLWLMLLTASLAVLAGDESLALGAVRGDSPEREARALSQAARRNLHLHELDELLKMGHVLLDRRLQSVENRSHAANLLGGRYAHRNAVPYLLTVALNRAESSGLRAACVRALSAIRDPVAIDSLIDLLDDPEVAVAEAANLALSTVSSRPDGPAKQKLDANPDAASRKRLKQTWQKWRDAERESAHYDAEAIEAIERLGGRIVFDDERPERPAVELYFMYGTTITDFEIVHLKELTSLERVRVEFIPITDRGLSALAGLKNLRTLFLSDVEGVTDAGMVHLKGLDNLRHLALSNTSITDSGLEHLNGMDKLESLNLFSTQVTDAGLSHLKGLTALTSLFLNGTQVRGPGLIILERMPALEKLGLSNCPVNDEGLANVARSRSLRTLGLHATSISSAGLAHLNDLRELRELLLGSTRIESPGLAHLKGLSHLEKLDLHRTRIDDEGLRHLKGLTRLQELNLSQTGITDAGLLALEHLKDLRTLQLTSTHITDDGLAHLEHLKKLETLGLSNTGVTDAGLGHLNELTDLRRLDLINCKVSEDARKDLQRTLPKVSISH